MEKYDLIVIGTGPAGEKAAVKAAYFGHRVAIIEKSENFGGAMVMTGTLPSKTLKETSLYFSGKYQKGLYGVERELSHETTISDFMYRKNFVTKTEEEEVKANLKRHKVDLFHGVASFEDPHKIAITQNEKKETIQGDYIIIATGSYPYHPEGIPFDGKRIHDSDTILELKRYPKSLCVVGAGVIGCEYTTIFATMGTQTYLVNNKDQILPFLDQEIADGLVQSMRDTGVNILFNTSIKELHVPKSDEEMITVHLENGEKLEVDMFLFAAGRSGQIKELQLDKAGVKTGKRETVIVDETYRTNIPHIFAVGDVIGFPALASTSADQGRVAVAHIFKTMDLDHLPSFFPYGIYTIPEVSMVGISEKQAKEKELHYLVGRSKYSDMARGKIMGAKAGMMKMVFDKDSLCILGIHIFGPIATEIVHFGLYLVEEKKTLYDVIGIVFNFPTLHDLYKYAAYDGLSTLVGHKVK